MIDGTEPDVVKAWRTVRDELDAYGEGLSEKTEFVTLNKIDALDPETRDERAAALEKATGQKPFLVSGVSGEGVTELLRAAFAEVRRGRAEAAASVEHVDWRP
jgi:GTP-binding protein